MTTHTVSPMVIRSLLDQQAQTLSFEFFPARTESGQAILSETVKQLAGLGPDFMTVTYGAGGSSQEPTQACLADIHAHTSIPTFSHLTCVNASKSQLQDYLNRIAEIGVSGVLALRGDPPKESNTVDVPADGCQHAADLIDLVQTDGRFAIAAAAFPEGHPEAVQREQDWDFLYEKFQRGADIAMSQLFFNVADYVAMMDYLGAKANADGTPVPRVVPGIMPVMSLSHIEKFTARFCPNATIPEAMRKALAPHEGNHIAARRAGMTYMTDFSAELLAAGAPGLHIYTMDKVAPAVEIVAALRRQGILH